jgi:hypothetical protein
MNSEQSVLILVEVVVSLLKATIYTSLAQHKYHYCISSSLSYCARPNLKSWLKHSSPFMGNLPTCHQQPLPRPHLEPAESSPSIKAPFLLRPGGVKNTRHLKRLYMSENYFMCYNTSILLFIRIINVDDFDFPSLLVSAKGVNFVTMFLS